MTGIRWLIAAGLTVIMTVDVSAQFFPPPPIVGLPVFVPNGIDFQYNSRRLKVGGFIATGGSSAALLPINPFGPVPAIIGPPSYYPIYPVPIYGVVDNRVTLQIINPPGIESARRGLAAKAQDLSGIDLDEEPASKIWGKRGGEKKIAAVKEERAPRAEAAKVAPPQERKVEANVVKPAPPPELPAKKDLVPEGQRLLDNGIAAFRGGDHGIAILRFRHLAEEDPPVTRALFLLGQAYIAVGKFREAAQVLQQALKRQPEWHSSGFRPRAELYGNDDDRWKLHVQRLEKAQRHEPNNADYLFLLGYLSWFDGQKDAAINYFRQARVLAPDVPCNDLFLQAAAKIGAK